MTRPWTLGSVFVLRHAGFPFDWLEALGFSPEFLTRVEALLQMEASLVAEVETVAGEKEVQALREALRRGQAPSPKVIAAAGCKDTLARYLKQRVALQTRYADERARLQPLLRETASAPEVQEAVFLSSPAMFDNVWARYLKRTEGGDNSDGRRAERQVYTYLQRFCAKNETTSFFGPMAYGELSSEGGGGELETSPSGSTRRRTFFSFWALGELVRAMNRDRGMRRDLPVRFNPLFTVEPTRVSCEPLELGAELGPEALRLLEALREAPSITGAARRLGQEPAAVERTALPLIRCAFLLVGLSMRTHDFGAFESLKEALTQLPSSDARERWLWRLKELGALKDAFERSGLDDRRNLLPQLEAFFSECTGKPARRGEGKVYSDRLIVYEEASSPFKVRVGRHLAAELAEKVSGALELSAAYVEQVQGGYRAQVAQALRDETRPLDFLEYAVKLRPSDVEGSRFAPVPPVKLPPEALRSRQVPARLCGESSPGGRYALPDVCLAVVSNPDGSRHFEVMVSRVHHHLLLWSWLSAFYPNRAAYESVAREWLDQDASARTLVGLSLRRRNKGFYVYPKARLAYSVSDVLDLDARATSARAVKVVVNDDGPSLVDAEGRRLRLYLPLDDFSTYPPFAALAHPLVLHVPLRGDGPHLPRLTVGGAVYQRERWELPAESFGSLSGLDLMLEVQRQAQRGRWPRFVFVRTSRERKPYLIDTRSPFALDLLSHLVRGSERISLEEMYPAPDQLWLKDGRGRYTCEMRMQAVRWSQESGLA
ncbi:MAG TPA: lantibiotic dehydratase [Myxococcaceae bacterium]|nr:lantibiotic dehydratase [Myxococcaceae bacterium]